MTKSFRAMAFVALAGVACGAHAGWFSNDPITEPFLKPDQSLAMSLSPDAQHLAMLVDVVDEDRMHTGLVVVDTDTGKMHMTAHSTVIWKDSTHYYYRDPVSVGWMSNDLLGVNFNDNTASQMALKGNNVGWLGAHYFGMIKLKSDQPAVALVGRSVATRSLGVVESHGATIKPFVLQVTGDSIGGWLTDASGLLRVVQTMETAKGLDATRIATWYRESGTAPWKKVIDQSILEDRITPVRIDDAPGKIVVQARNGRDRYAMWDYDTNRQAFTGVGAEHPLEDIVSVDADADAGTREFKRVMTDGLKPQTIWFDPDMARLQAAVDAALPGHVNTLQGSPTTRVLVVSRSDVDPGKVLVLNPTTMSMREITRIRPGADPTRMQPMRTLQYPSFDGLSIPAYLTLPGQPTGPAPLIVLIHGGPQARDHWGWNQEVQVFAAHGYAVFQPQFRGSQGFGKHFEEAGYGQWGQAMQQDITAGVRYLVDQKIADPARICIVGASYGGYAALWGLVQDPDLYKCGVSVAGVSDLESQFLTDSDVSKSAVQREFTRARVGDPTLMKATFDTVSPLKHADRIRVPLLLVHGTLDERVPLSQGRNMYRQMRALGKDVKWLEFDDEAHTLWHIKNQRDYYEAVFDLLERTIGKGIQPGAPAAH